MLDAAAGVRQKTFMLHLIKLCVGVESLEELARWQKQRLAEKKKKGQKPELVHITRQTPKRAGELLDGGSLYWVIKGVAHCGLVYDKKLMPVIRRSRAAFQGWRYLDPADAPADIGAIKGAKGLPEKLQQELAALGLL